MGDKILIKQTAPSVFQQVGAQGTRPSFMDFARNTFGEGGQGITPGQRVRGAIGMAGKAAAAGVTALNTADSLQQGNVSAPLQAGISYQGYDPTATIDPNVGDKINQNAQFKNPTPTYDYTQSSFPINQFVQNPGVSPTGVAVQQPQPQQPQVGYGAGSPTLGQAAQAQQTQQQQAQQPQQPVQAQQQQEIQPRPLDTNTTAPVAISTGTVVPMGSAQAGAMNTTQTATPNTLNTGAMMDSGGFVPTQATIMDERSNQLQGLAPVPVRQPIQQPPQEPIQQQTANIDPEMRAYLESIKQPFTDTNENDIMSEEEAYRQAWGKSEFTNMLFDILGPDNLYKMTPNEIGELAAYMYIKTR